MLICNDFSEHFLDENIATRKQQSVTKLDNYKEI